MQYLNKDGVNVASESVLLAADDENGKKAIGLD